MNNILIVSETLKVEDYIKLMENIQDIHYLVSASKSYKSAIDKYISLLNLTAGFKDIIGFENYGRFTSLLIYRILDCLDHLDDWQGYLTFCDMARKFDFNLTYSLEADPKRFGEYYIRSDKTNHYVHFLYSVGHRKHIVEKKLRKKISKEKLGNYYHKQQEELSSSVLINRFERTLNKIIQLKRSI